jgi:hypothetical protein
MTSEELLDFCIDVFQRLSYYLKLNILEYTDPTLGSHMLNLMDSFKILINNMDLDCLGQTMLPVIDVVIGHFCDYIYYIPYSIHVFKYMQNRDEMIEFIKTQTDLPMDLFLSKMIHYPEKQFHVLKEHLRAIQSSAIGPEQVAFSEIVAKFALADSKLATYNVNFDSNQNSPLQEASDLGRTSSPYQKDVNAELQELARAQTPTIDNELTRGDSPVIPMRGSSVSWAIERGLTPDSEYISAPEPVYSYDEPRAKLVMPHERIKTPHDRTRTPDKAVNLEPHERIKTPHDRARTPDKVLSSEKPLPDDPFNLYKPLPLLAKNHQDNQRQQDTDEKIARLFSYDGKTIDLENAGDKVGKLISKCYFQLKTSTSNHDYQTRLCLLYSIGILVVKAQKNVGTVEHVIPINRKSIKSLKRMRNSGICD